MELLKSLLTCYGVFLITCGIISVLFIGMKAKTALASGGLSGVIALVMAYLAGQGNTIGQYGGLVLTLMLFGVFSWRSTKTLFKIFELLQSNMGADELKGKGIAFLIISLMAVMSIVVFVAQVVLLL
jgi:uncharacterized membrane protein (UPF0136 family)